MYQPYEIKWKRSKAEAVKVLISKIIKIVSEGRKMERCIMNWKRNEEIEEQQGKEERQIQL